MRLQHSDYIDICGCQLYYEIAGEGDVIVLIHGNMLDRRMWDFNIGCLAEHYRVIRYDMRGFGRSGRRGSTVGASVEDLKRLLDHLSIDKAVICGASMGGVTATHFALEWPGRTSGLILVDSDLSGFPISAEFAETILRTHHVLKHGDTSSACEIWLNHPMLIHVRDYPEADALLRQMVEEYTWEDWLDGKAYLLKPGAIKRLGEIEAATLVVAGEKDLPRFHAIADYFTGHIPGARKEVIAGGSHVPNMEVPGVFNDCVLEFLEMLNDVVPG